MSACADCPRLIALQRQLTEAREELRAWEANDRDAARDDDEAEALGALMLRLALTRATAKALLLLISKAGRVVSKEALFSVVAGDEDCDIKLVDVQICKLRDRLHARLPVVDITTVWGVGYALSLADAARIRDALQDDGGRLPAPPPPVVLTLPAPSTEPLVSRGGRVIAPAEASSTSTELATTSEISGHARRFLSLLRSAMSDRTVGELVGRSPAWVRRTRQALRERDEAEREAA